MDSAEYTNIEDQDTWTVGDIPEVKVELSAKDGYKVLLYIQKPFLSSDVMRISKNKDL